MFSIRREYVPITMDKLQKMIDTNRIDVSQPIDVVQLCNTGLLLLRPEERQYGFQLKDEGISKFKAKIHIEVQHASELIISTIERNGGVIRSAFYDPISLMAMKDTERFFKCGKPIPKRMVPPQDAVEYYSDPKNRGYLADPEAIAKERLVKRKKKEKEFVISANSDSLKLSRNFSSNLKLFSMNLFVFALILFISSCLFSHPFYGFPYFDRFWRRNMDTTYRKLRMIHSMKCSVR